MPRREPKIRNNESVRNARSARARRRSSSRMRAPWARHNARQPDGHRVPRLEHASRAKVCADSGDHGFDHRRARRVQSDVRTATQDGFSSEGNSRMLRLQQPRSNRVPRTSSTFGSARAVGSSRHNTSDRRASDRKYSHAVHDDTASQPRRSGPSSRQATDVSCRGRQLRLRRARAIARRARRANGVPRCAGGSASLNGSATPAGRRRPHRRRSHTSSAVGTRSPPQAHADRGESPLTVSPRLAVDDRTSARPYTFDFGTARS